MTTKTRKKILYASFWLWLLCSGPLLYAQGGPGGGGPDPDPGPGTRVPFDGGLSLVIAAGLAYAAKKGYDKRKKTNTEEAGR